MIEIREISQVFGAWDINLYATNKVDASSMDQIKDQYVAVLMGWA